MKKPHKLYFFLFIFIALHVCAQSPNSTEVIIRKVADHVLRDAVFAFEGTDDHVTYTSAKDIPENVAVKYKNKWVGWHYTHGVLNMAMINLGNYLNDERYNNFARQHVAFGMDNYKIFEQWFKHDVPHFNYPYGELFTMNELDDFGAMGASVMDVYNTVKRPDYKAYVEKAAKHLEEERLRMADGTLIRSFPEKNTIWGDDLYMSVPFLVRMYKLSGNSLYLNDAIKQVINFNKYLWDDRRQLYYHCYYTDSKQNGVAHWGRCNGWIALAQVHLLNFLPANHPMRKQLIELLQRQIIGLSRYQHIDGSWHQLLDKDDSYSESSCSAMFVYAIARAVNEGWIDKRYASIALTGWEGLVKNKITEDGQLKDICVGTDIRNDLQYYYQRPTGLNEKHGLGALLDAGVEVMKLQKALILRKPVPDKLVVLTFDDAAKSHFNYVAPILKKYGFNATFFVCEFLPDFNDTTKYMTWGQIKELAQQGFEIGNHTRHHIHVNKLDKNQLIDQLAYINNKCDSLQIKKPVSFAYPGYDTYQPAIETMLQQGISIARIGDDRIYDPMKDHPFYIPSFSTSGNDPKKVIEAIDQAKNGHIVVLTVHGVPDFAHDWVTTPPALFESYMKYLHDNNYKVISMNGLFEFIDVNKALLLPISSSVKVK